MRILVYTSVFGGYDRVFAPMTVERGVDYVIFTDDATLDVPGWRVLVVGDAGFRTARAANRRYKMLGHRMVGTHDASVYVDGNVRILGPLSPLVSGFLETGAALGIYPHPRRSSVAEEAEACLADGKVSDPSRVHQELAAYAADGFPDRDPLVEATILLKNHAHPGLDEAMALWWSLFERYGNRDQFSLPYVLWKTGLQCDRQPSSFREPNPFFGIYPHLGAKGISPMYTYLSARSFDSRIHRWCLDAWHAKWWLQRRIRRRNRVDAIPTDVT